MGLKDKFAEHGMKLGLAVTLNNLENKEQAACIKEHFNSLTMENAMKPDFILDHKRSKETGDIVVSFNPEMIKIMEWAEENGFSMRGHTIVWHGQTPEWIFYEDFDTAKTLVDRETMLLRLDSYMRQIFERLDEGDFTKLFYAYDIVNEAWREDGSMRQSLWYKTIGEDYLWHAFYLADKYAPESIDLYYNDYNEQQKTENCVKFVETLKDENGRYLIDGIGLQAHMYTEDDLDVYFKMLDTLAKTGLKLQLTELDVCLGAFKNTAEATAENLKLQAAFYKRLVDGIFERVDAGMLKTDALTVWGLADDMSWRREGNPLIFGTNLSKKPAYYALEGEIMK